MKDKKILDNANYGMWLLDMWLKGYGSYNEIEKKVASGELVPDEDYPDIRSTIFVR